MVYSKQTWTNNDPTTPLSGPRLTHLEDGVDGAYDRANHTGTQTASTISDLTEIVQDIVASLLVEGTNITLTYDDVAGTLTVTSSGGASLTSYVTDISSLSDYPTSFPTQSSDISDATTLGQSLLTATDAGTARTAIGAGTSDLVVGTGATDAKAGNYQPTADDISDASTVGKSVLTAANSEAIKTTLALENVDNTADNDKPVSTAQATAISDAQAQRVNYSTSATDRGTARTDVMVIFLTATDPSAVMLTNDEWHRTTA